MVSVIAPKKLGLKRKIKHDGHSQRKKQKKGNSTTSIVDSIDALPWRSVARPSETTFEGDDGILMLEEVDDVEVLYEETKHGKVAKFKLHENADTKEAEDINEQSDSGSIPVTEETPFDVTLLPEWQTYSLHSRLLASLHAQNFLKPTPIQAAALPKALEGKDVVGIAQTGSGKTLAYGLPILNQLLNSNQRKKRSVKALILTPTRELALQVADHLRSAVEGTVHAGKGKAKDESGRVPPVSVAAIVGGLSMQKQKRILERGADIVVATPGRLWDVVEEDDALARQLKNLRFFVLDEADRMIENGHFEELDNIVRLTRRTQDDEKIEPEFQGFADVDLRIAGDQKAEGSSDTESNTNANDGDDAVPVKTQGNEDSLQTFIFSATLSRDLQRNLKKCRRYIPGKKEAKISSTLDELLFRLDFRDPNPEVVDLSPVGGSIETLRESMVECLSNDKDYYLYYFLLRHPGRTLVFLSSIDGIRRLSPILDLLQVNAFPLHSQLQQRQRLKNLDRFKSTPNAVLLATDVAARGLDIPAVEHVLHYQTPRTADAYVHRCGRTARAFRDGFSLLMCAPEERGVVKSLMNSLGRASDGSISEFPIEMDLLDKLKSRVQLARKIDSMQHKVKKENHEKKWLREAAEAMEIELDSDFEGDSDEELSSQRKKAKRQAHQVHALKSELKQLLAQPLVALGISKRYLTSGSRNVVDDLLGGDHPDSMLGFHKGDAKEIVDHVQGKEPKSGKKKSRKM